MHIKRERKCIACKETKQQVEMLRVAKVDGNYFIDSYHKLNGRGAYICKNSQCLADTRKKRLLNRAFKTNVLQDIYDKLGEYEQGN